MPPLAAVLGLAEPTPAATSFAPKEPSVAEMLHEYRELALFLAIVLGHVIGRWLLTLWGPVVVGIVYAMRS